MSHVAVLLQQIKRQIRSVSPRVVLGVRIPDQVAVGGGVRDEAVEQDFGGCFADLDVGAGGEGGEVCMASSVRRGEGRGGGVCTSVRVRIWRRPWDTPRMARTVKMPGGG